MLAKPLNPPICFAPEKRRISACAIGCMAVIFALAVLPSSALATPVKGSAFIAGSWMIGSQSYFSVSILGQTTIGWCMNPGAAEPLPGWYSFTADKSVESTGQASVWLEGSLEPVSYDENTGISTSSPVVFRSGSPDAAWDVVVPAGCVLFVDGRPHAAGSLVSIRPGQSAWIESSSPAQTRVAVLSGNAHATSSVRAIYSNIIIVPPGAWDGHSYANGLPAGYQRVGVGPVTVETISSTAETISESIELAADVRYYVDGENEACWSESAPIGSTFLPSDAAYLAGSKPSCTPGLDAWYFDPKCTLPHAPFVLAGDTNLYGQNWCTVSFLPATPSGFQQDTPAVESKSADTPAVALANILPDRIVATWGSRIILPAPETGPLYFHDGTRWRTLRRPGNGWHQSPSASDDQTTSIVLREDARLYDFWTTSTFDGVLGW